MTSIIQRECVQFTKVNNTSPSDIRNLKRNSRYTCISNACRVRQIHMNAYDFLTFWCIVNTHYKLRSKKKDDSFFDICAM